MGLFQEFHDIGGIQSDVSVSGIFDCREHSVGYLFQKRSRFVSVTPHVDQLNVYGNFLGFYKEHGFLAITVKVFVYNYLYK